MAVTWFMVGLIWFVQVVHYPLFAEVGTREFSRYEREHSMRTTWIVLPAMGLELLSSLALWHLDGGFLSTSGALLTGAVWLSTLLVQAPIHGQLIAGFDRVKWQRLVGTNRFRTAAWTIRGMVAFALFYSIIS